LAEYSKFDLRASLEICSYGVEGDDLGILRTEGSHRDRSDEQSLYSKWREPEVVGNPTRL
jgi:hypothetical protein